MTSHEVGGLVEGAALGWFLFWFVPDFLRGFFKKGGN